MAIVTPAEWMAQQEAAKGAAMPPPLAQPRNAKKFNSLADIPPPLPPAPTGPLLTPAQWMAQQQSTMPPAVTPIHATLEEARARQENLMRQQLGAAPAPAPATSMADRINKSAILAKLEQQAQQKQPGPSFLENLSGATLSTLDLAPEFLQSGLEQISYPFARAMGESATEATKSAKRVAEVVPTIASVFGLDKNNPIYTNPFEQVSNVVTDLIGNPIDKAITKIAKTTGAPKEDVSNIFASVATAIGARPGVVKKGVEKLTPNAENRKLQAERENQGKVEANNNAANLELKIVNESGVGFANRNVAYETARKSNEKRLWERLMYGEANLPRDTKVDAKAFDARIGEIANKGYAGVRNAPAVKNPSPEIVGMLDDISRTDYSVDQRPIINNTVNDLRKVFGKENVSPNEVFKFVQRLRTETKNYRDSKAKGVFVPDDQAVVPKKKIEIADALDGWLEQNTPKDVAGQYKDTRKKLAEMYELKNATNFGSSTIDADYFAKRVNDGSLSDKNSAFYKVGQVASVYPELFKSRNQEWYQNALVGSGLRGSPGALLTGAAMYGAFPGQPALATAAALAAGAAGTGASYLLGQAAARVPKPVKSRLQQQADMPKTAATPEPAAAPSAASGAAASGAVVPVAKEGELITQPGKRNQPNWVPVGDDRRKLQEWAKFRKANPDLDLPDYPPGMVPPNVKVSEQPATNALPSPDYNKDKAARDKTERDVIEARARNYQAQQQREMEAAKAKGRQPPKNVPPRNTRNAVVPVAKEGELFTLRDQNWVPGGNQNRTPASGQTVRFEPPTAPAALPSPDYSKAKAVRDKIERQKAEARDRAIETAETSVRSKSAGEGLELTFVDKNGTLTVTTPQGNKLDLSVIDKSHLNRPTLIKVSRKQGFDMSSDDKLVFKGLKREFVEKYPEFAKLSDDLLAKEMLKKTESSKLTPEQLLKRKSVRANLRKTENQ